MIPTAPKEKDFTNSAPSFVRNVMGSSAGAGSGEFHVYRNLRRKEYARVKGIEEKSRREQQDEEFQNRLEQNRRLAEERTAKKRAKRLKKKEKTKSKKRKIDGDNKSDDSSDFDLNNLLDSEDECESTEKTIESANEAPLSEQETPKETDAPDAKEEPSNTATQLEEAAIETSGETAEVAEQNHPKDDG